MVGPPSVHKQGTLKYDSTVDNDQDPKIFVIYKDNQAYPEYIVTFTYMWLAVYDIYVIQKILK